MMPTTLRMALASELPVFVATSMPAVLAVLWGGAVLLGAWRWRPAPGRLVAFVGSSRHGVARRSPLARFGGFLRRTTGREADPVQDWRVGVGVICTGLAFLVSPLASIGTAVAAALWSKLAMQKQRRRAEELVVASVPETIDLFVLAASAGHPVQRSLQLVALHAGGPAGRALEEAARQVNHGVRTAEALDAVAERLGDAVRPLIGVLTSSERYGTPLVPALERLAADARVDRRRRGEEAARRVPVKLLFPLVLCTLPAFALLTVVPLLVGAFGSLRL